MKLDGLYLIGNGPARGVYGPKQRARIERWMRPLAEPMPPSQATADPATLRQAQVIFSSWGMPRLDQAFLDAAPRLEAVFYGAGAIGGFMTREAWERGVRVSSAYAANAVPVAEFTVAHVYLALKHYFRYIRTVREAKAYPRPKRWDVPGAYGSTVGLVSLGMIGQMVSKRLAGSDLTVIAHDPVVDKSIAARLGVELVSLEDLFKRSDVVSLHLPLLEETRGIIGGEHMGAMKDGATLINTSRGAVVREDGLIQTAEARPDLSFILDVTDPEPPEEGSPLYTLGNVWLTPHIAGSQSQECRRMGQYMAEEFERYANGQPLHWEIGQGQAANSTHRVR